MKWGVLFLLFCVTQSAPAQNNQFEVTGRVVDEITGEPIENANVFIKNTSNGTTTNELGEFTISYNSLPLILEFSHISFKTKLISIKFHPIRDLQITLEQAVRELSQVTILSQRIDTLYANEYYSVLDYELVEEGILVLIFKTRLSHSELILLNNQNQITQDLKVLPGKPLALIRDCLAEIQLIFNDKISQVRITEDKLFLLRPYAHEEYKRVMDGCLFLAGKNLFFEEFSPDFLAKRFFYIDTLDGSEHLLKEITDLKKIEFLKDNPENNGLFFSSRGDIENLKGLPGDAGALEIMRNLDVTTRFNKMAYLSDIYAPIFKLGDSICVFNHPDGCIEIYNMPDSLLQKTPINYHIAEKKNPLSTLSHAFVKPTKWEEQVIADETKRKVYAVFKNINGTRDIKEVDLFSGSVRFITTIPYPYVDKIKINNGNLYYVYKGWGEGQTKKLFRQRIN
ncbi:MAG: carboxypeptidase-like regulatory domain-containing protein [Bacteroidales bacterium]